MDADLYTRKSTIDTAKSLVGQESEARRDAERFGWQIAQVFSDPELSGSRFARKPRPDFQALLTHIRSGGCRGLVLWESSRGSRNLSEWIGLLELCRDQRIPIRITSHARTYEVWNRRDWKTLAEEGIDAHDESEKTSERVLRGMRSSALAGRPAARAPFGYVREFDERGHYARQVPDPAKAAVVRDTAARIIAGDHLRDICRTLNAGDVTPSHGTTWFPQTIRQMVLNPTYRGARTHHGVVVAEDCWPAILDPATQARCAEVLNNPDRRTSESGTLRHLLSRILHCGRCETGVLGAKWLNNKGRKLRMYGCIGCNAVFLNADHLDPFITDLVLARLRRPDARKFFDPPKVAQRVLAARREEAKLRRDLDEYYEAAGRKQLSPEGLIRMEQLLLPQIADAKARGSLTVAAGSSTPGK
jgi:site-specific DNA recombinase